MGKRVLTAYQRAFEDGEINKALETARRMKEEGFNLGQILKITGLSENQLRENGIL
jgi:predicted transposase/invertase (TIGR01784 family)